MDESGIESQSGERRAAEEDLLCRGDVLERADVQVSGGAPRHRTRVLRRGQDQPQGANISSITFILNHILRLGSVGFRSQFTTQTSISSLNTLTSQYSVYQIDEDQISLNKDRPLGEGNFGIVFKGMYIFSLN